MGKPQNAELLNAQTSLDFANTVSNRGSAHPQEHLGDYASLLEWAVQAGGLAEPAAQMLRQHAVSNPAAARQAYKQALDVRESIYRLLEARAMGSKGSVGDLEAFNQALGQVMAYARLVAVDGAYEWSWRTNHNPPFDYPWWEAIRSSAVLLSSPDLLERLGRCADPQCGWLFLDTSKNHTRRWCDINDCGNRAKQKRYRKKRDNNQLSIIK